MTAINWVWQTQKYWNTKGGKNVCGERRCSFSAVWLFSRSGLLARNLIISHSCIKSLFAHNSKHIDLGTPAWTWRSTSSRSRERSGVPFKPWREQNTDGAFTCAAGSDLRSCFLTCIKRSKCCCIQGKLKLLRKAEFCTFKSIVWRKEQLYTFQTRSALN